jgi:outer membrane murein-binding lipoprotein Lpp
MTGKLMTGVVVATLLTGCVSQGPQRADGTTSTTDDQTRTKVEGTVLGALVGGLIGAAAGDTKGALIGAAVGAGVGFIAGNEVAKRKAQYAREEDFLNAEIAQAEQMNREAAGYNAAKYRAGTASRNELAAQRSSVQKQMEANAKVEQTLRNEYDVKTAVLKEERSQRGANDPYVKSLERQVRELQANIDNLHKGSTQLARIDERLSL